MSREERERPEVSPAVRVFIWRFFTQKIPNFYSHHASPPTGDRSCLALKVAKELHTGQRLVAHRDTAAACSSWWLGEEFVRDWEPTHEEWRAAAAVTKEVFGE